jgi:hypothetical protein
MASADRGMPSNNAISPKKSPFEKTVTILVHPELAYLTSEIKSGQ